MRRAHVYWFTGLSGSGKSTIADAIRQRCEAAGLVVCVLDGDVIRSQAHQHLGFSPEDIMENNRLIAQRCAELRTTADVILVPIISPFASSRSEARALLAPEFFEVHCDANLSCVIQRDVKGLYARAARGDMTDMIGYAATRPYESPATPDILLRTGTDTIDCSVATLDAHIHTALSVRRQAQVSA